MARARARQSHWLWLGSAAIAGAAIALYATARRQPRRLAHRVDGSDDSASFAAGIADEGTIPDVAA